MEQTPFPSDTVTFKRSHFYSVLVVLSFAIGILVGYLAWGRPGTVATPADADNNQAAVIPAPTQAIRRYDIPTEGFNSIGPQDAPIVIVEFSDFQCPYCKRWHDQVYESLMAAYPGRIRLVYRNLPLTQIHPQAMPAAEASLCAGEQNAYWQYHEKLFENSDALNDDLYGSIASKLGLDTNAFEACMSAHKYQSEIETDMQFAINLGVQSTPTFFINGLAMVGAQPLNAFQQVIDDELAGKIPDSPTVYEPTQTVPPSPVPSPVPTAASMATPSAAPVTCTVKTGIDAGELNLRAGAGMSFDVVDVLSEGDILTLMETDLTGWLKVQTASAQIGWVSPDYVICESIQ